MTDTVSILAEAFEDHQRGAAEPGASLFEFMAKRLAAASPQGEGSSADWMKHDGGPNPVPGKMVEVRYRNGETETRTANRLGWNHWEAETPGLGGYDIIAYRVTEGVKP